MKRFKFWLLNLIVKHVYKAVMVQDVLTIGKDGRLFLNGVQMSDAEIHAVQEEAKFLQRTRLWTIITNTLNDQAQKRMFEKSKTWDDMFFGKASLYNLDIQETIVAKFKDYTFRQ